MGIHPIFGQDTDTAIICVNLIEKSTVESLIDIGFSKT